MPGLLQDLHEQSVTWGYALHGPGDPLPEGFLSAIDPDDPPSGFSNVEYVMEGYAITDTGLGVLYSPFLEIPDNAMVAVDGRLLKYIQGFWVQAITARFADMEDFLVGASGPIAVGVAYGHDQLADVFNKVMGIFLDSIQYSEAVGVPSIDEDTYTPAYMVLHMGAIRDIAILYVETAKLMEDMVASVEANEPVGLVEGFVIAEQESRPKARGVSGPTAAMIVFAGFGAAAIFATTLLAKGGD